jgi:hypothetical protein
MSKLDDFYQKAKTDSALKAELAEATKGYVAGVIATAAKHGVTYACRAPAFTFAIH